MTPPTGRAERVGHTPADMSAEMRTAAAMIAETATGLDDHVVLAVYRALYNRPRATLEYGTADGGGDEVSVYSGSRRLWSAVRHESAGRQRRRRPRADSGDAAGVGRRVRPSATAAPVGVPDEAASDWRPAFGLERGDPRPRAPCRRVSRPGRASRSGRDAVVMFRIIPNSLRDAISAKLDAAIAECPAAEEDREVLYEQLLDYFDEHGRIPDFSLALNAQSSGASHVP